MRPVIKTVLCIAVFTLLPLTTVKAKDVMIQYENKQELDAITSVIGKNIVVLPTVKIVTASLESKELSVLQKLPYSLKIEEDEDVEILQQSSLAQTLATFNPIWNLNIIKANEAWKMGITGAEVKIAVIDTGVNMVQEMPTVKAHISFAPDDPSTSTVDESDVIDRGKNGYGHGTAVASVIASQPGGFYIGSSPLVGIAPQASIYSVKYMDGSSTGKTSNLIKSINWAIDNKMNIINISSGLKTDVSALKESINLAVSKGIFVVASAGNDGLSTNLTYPARYPNVIGVSSINKSMYYSSFSNSGKRVNFTAPGEKIPTINKDGSLIYSYGTSFSAPHITGLIALLKERYPFSSYNMIEKHLKESVVDLGSNGFDSIYGYGVPTYTSSAPVKIKDRPKIKVKSVSDHQILLTITKGKAYKNWRSVISVDGKIRSYSRKATFKLTNLQAATKHRIEVRYMSDLEDVSEAALLKVTTKKDVTAPQSPLKLKGVLTSKNTVKISWRKQLESDYSHTLVYENNRLIGKTSKTALTSTTTLKRRSNYSYKVIAVDYNGNRSKAATISIIRLQ